MAIINIYRVLISILIFYNSETAYELFSIGSQLEFDDRIEEAIEYYKRARELAPESPEIYVSLANALYKIRQFNEGIQVATEGLSLWPDRTEMYHTLAIGNIGKGNFNAAIMFYEKSLQMEPENINIYNNLSILYEGIGNIDKAGKVLLNLPDSLMTSEVFMRLATLAGKLNDHKSAIEYYRQGYTLDTTKTVALIGIGTAFDIMNIKDSAIHYYEKSLREDTLILTVGRRLIELYTETERYESLLKIARGILYIDYKDEYVRRSLGYALYKMGMLHEALNEFMIAAKIDPQDTYSRFYIGRIYLEDGDYEAALNEIEQAIKIDPYFVELWVYLGFIAIEKKDFKTAEYAFIEAAHHGGDMVQIYYLLGVITEMQQQYSGAYFYYHKSLKVDPNSLTSLEALANLCDRIGKKVEAFKTFQKIITLDTTNVVALNYVSYTYAERNDSLEYALELINKALSIEENNGYYIDSRGWILYQMEKYEEALADLKRATEIVEDAVILEHLGDVYKKLNDIDKARDAYQRALEYNIKSKVLKKKLQKLTE